MKKLYFMYSILLTGLFSIHPVYAGLITHNDYISGGIITASGQNTNENTIVNEFNGNIESANIKDGTIATADIADGNITYAKLASVLQSTFTYVNTFGTYRRPNLKWISITTVDVENNTGTANQTCIEFPDERRCVTEDTSSTSVNRRFIITEAASNSGTKNSGLVGATEAVNMNYALYAWKVSDNSTDFVIAGTTNTPTQGDYSRLNSMFGTNGWVYLGLITNGDGTGGSSDILNFLQSGNITKYRNTLSANPVNTTGYILATTASNVSSTFTYTTGMPVGSIPANITDLYLYVGIGTVNAGATIRDAASIHAYGNKMLVNDRFLLALPPIPATEGLLVSAGTATTIDIDCHGFIDGALGIGYNPQL